MFVRRALAGDEIELFGDGSQLRDCLHVDDIVDALLLAASTPEAEGEVFNLGHSGVLPLSEIARLTIAAAAPGRAAGAATSSVRCVAWPDELERIDIGSFHGDFGKARRVLGWEPRITFADGIAATLAWYRARRVIPVVDLTRRLARHESAFLEAVSRVIRSGTLLLGPELAAFEAEGAAALGEQDLIGVASGAAAIQLALEGLGIGAGDEVVVPAFTAVPTASAVFATGATPVPVDVDAHTALIDVAAVAAAITDRTRAIIPVHLYGRPVDIDELEAAVSNGADHDAIAIVEDAAQAHGATSAHPRVAATAYSFYPTKNLGGIGDGGAVGTADPALAEAIRRRRTHGMTEQYVHVDVSQNFRMSELEAAWLRLQLDDFVEATHRRRTIARHYRDAAPQLDWQTDHERHVFHLCVARVGDRDAARSQLAEAGVATAIHYPLAITEQPAYRDLPGPPCPQAERWAHGCMSVPCFPELTDAEVETVGLALAQVRP